MKTQYIVGQKTFRTNVRGLLFTHTTTMRQSLDKVKIIGDTKKNQMRKEFDAPLDS